MLVELSVCIIIYNTVFQKCYLSMIKKTNIILNVQLMTYLLYEILKREMLQKPIFKWGIKCFSSLTYVE